MNKKYLILALFAGTFFISAKAMKETITYARAQEKDVAGIVDLINKEAIHDDKKIVILPEKFRAGATEGAVKQKRMFVAHHKDLPVAYKKAFILDDAKEKTDTLENEIRCRSGKRTLAGYYDGDTAIFTPTPKAEKSEYPDSNVYIYNGADFTHPTYRGHGINKGITDTAFTHLAAATKIAIKKAPTHARLALIYGLTNANAGEKGGIDRTPHILKSFIPFIKALGLDHTTIHHERFRAFMPTFDARSEECIPLPDDQSIPGYGCVLSVPLNARK